MHETGNKCVNTTTSWSFSLSGGYGAGAGLWASGSYSIVNELSVAHGTTQSVLGTPNLLEAFGF